MCAPSLLLRSYSDPVFVLLLCASGSSTVIIVSLTVLYCLLAVSQRFITRWHSTLCFPLLCVCFSTDDALLAVDAFDAATKEASNVLKIALRPGTGDNQTNKVSVLWILCCSLYFLSLFLVLCTVSLPLSLSSAVSHHPFVVCSALSLSLSC